MKPVFKTLDTEWSTKMHFKWLILSPKCNECVETLHTYMPKKELTRASHYQSFPLRENTQLFRKDWFKNNKQTTK